MFKKKKKKDVIVSGVRRKKAKTFPFVGKWTIIANKNMKRIVDF